MIKYCFLFLTLTGAITDALAQKLSLQRDLQDSWLKYENGSYQPAKESDISNTLYFKLDLGHYPGSYLQLGSSRNFFVFFNGKISGEFKGNVFLKADSLSQVHQTNDMMVTIYQQDINPRDLKTVMLSKKTATGGFEMTPRLGTWFRDFVITAGMLIIILFLLATRLNPKLAADYFSLMRIFSTREADDAQSNARLTSSSNIQFYMVCSLLLGFYLMIIQYHLPDAYALPLYFKTNGFWSAIGQWLKISMIILIIFFIKILLIFSFTRLFGLKGLTRVHFFNWVRLLLIGIGTFSAVLFIYYILRGRSTDIFIVFLSLIIATLAAWIFIVLLKLTGKSEHSMFHLFSYICATEVIPLLITIRVLFQ